jgi:hypothetical protein
MSVATDPNIFKRKPRYLNYRDYEVDENFGDPYYYRTPRYAPDGTRVNPAMSTLAVNELGTTTRQGYGSRIAGFSQFSMKPLETRNNNEESVNTVFAKGMNRTTLATPAFYVQPLPSRYQILDPKPDEFSVNWSQPNPKARRPWIYL